MKKYFDRYVYVILGSMIRQNSVLYISKIGLYSWIVMGEIPETRGRNGSRTQIITFLLLGDSIRKHRSDLATIFHSQI
jgi:hypothetical protein